MQRLTSQGVVQLRTMLNVARLAALQNTDQTRYASEAQQFYAAYDRCLPWISARKPTLQAREMIREFEGAEEKGLRPEDYGGLLWRRRLAIFDVQAPPSELDLIRFDVALTLTTMRFTSDLHNGRVNPETLHFSLGTHQKKLDLSSFVREQLVSARDPHVAIESIEPQFLAYRRTLRALRMYLQLRHRDDGELLPNPARVVEPGTLYAGVPRLQRLLKLLGDLDTAAQPTTMTYDERLVRAVKHFQARHGLEPTGLLDSATLRELNTPISRRISQLQLTLERWRWLPTNFERPPIIVNIPEFRLHIVDENHHIVSSMNVIVGRAYNHETPVFESQIGSVVFRPFWNVPLEIQRDELVPEIEKSAQYLAENSYEIVDAHGNMVGGEITEQTMDSLRSGQLFMRQRPGPENSLGLIKFDLPNPFGIYLHGTPIRGLFSKSRRDFSHGCVRVEDPVGLAVWVLRDNPGWTAERVRAVMKGSDTLRVDVLKPTPIWILYGTATVLEDGQVRFYQDIYGDDAALEAALMQTNLEPSE